MTRVAKVFELNRQGFNLRRGVIFAVILGLLIIVGVLPHERVYFLTALFGGLSVALSDLGGDYSSRVPRMAIFAVAGALLTALGFGIGGGAWGWVVLAVFVAIAFGLQLPSAYWMPVAAIIAMKPSLQQSTFVAEQRVAGTVVGAAVAAVVLLAVDNKTALEVIIVVLFALAASIRTVNYAWYSAAMAGAILIGIDVPHPSSLTDEGRRILWTLAGVGVAVIVMFLADRLQKHAAKAAPPAPAPQGQAACVSGQGAVGPVPGTRPRATASMVITNIGVATGTANGRAFGQHGRDAASRASWLALTPRGLSRVRHDW